MEKVEFQTHPLRHLDDPEIQNGLQDQLLVLD